MGRDNKADEKLVQLLTSYQQGNRQALNVLCLELKKIINGYFWKKFNDEAVVNDLTQETYLRLIQSLPNLRQPMKLLSFVAKIAVHVSLDYLRKQHYQKRKQVISFSSLSQENKLPFEESVDWFETNDNLIDQLTIEQALNELPEIARKILLMRADGYKFEEISSELKMSLSAVKMQAKRNLEHLKKVIFIVTFGTIITTVVIKAIFLSCIH
jgi:RNA polymerase sigma factor (sigma-70 family)